MNSYIDISCVLLVHTLQYSTKSGNDTRNLTQSSGNGHYKLDTVTRD